MRCIVYLLLVILLLMRALVFPCDEIIIRMDSSYKRFLYSVSKNGCNDFCIPGIISAKFTCKVAKCVLNL